MLANINIIERAIIIGVIFIIPLFLVWGLQSFMHGIKIADKMIIRAALLIVIVLVPMGIFFAFIPVSLKDTSRAIIMILVLICYWGYSILRLIRRSRKGQILLKAASITADHIFILILSATILIIIGKQLLGYFTPSGSVDLKATPGISDICVYLLLLTFSIQFIFGSIEGVQITENGIFCPYRGMIKWDNIRSYAWAGRYDATLVLRLNKGFWKNIYLRIPFHQKDSAEAVLSEKIARTTQSISIPA